MTCSRLSVLPCKSILQFEAAETHLFISPLSRWHPAGALLGMCPGQLPVRNLMPWLVRGFFDARRPTQPPGSGEMG